MDIDKGNMKSATGQYITQALFLEPTYDTRFAIYTFGEDDKVYKGKTYYSIKKLYLDMEDLTEYQFANEYFCGWKHWKQLQGNKAIAYHIEEWREELEVKIRSVAIRDIIQITADQSQGSFQAAKWLVDKGWDKRGAGRPSKAEVKREERIKDRIAEEYNGDIVRMQDFKLN